MNNEWIIFLAGVLVGAVVGAIIGFLMFGLCKNSYQMDEADGLQEWQVKS